MLLEKKRFREVKERPRFRTGNAARCALLSRYVRLRSPFFADEKSSGIGLKNQRGRQYTRFFCRSDGTVFRLVRVYTVRLHGADYTTVIASDHFFKRRDLCTYIV